MRAEAVARVLALMDAEVAEIEADERYPHIKGHYPVANVVVNAPLALVQLEMTARLRAIKRYAEALRVAGEAKARAEK